jgi:HK97 family phage prohead protease
MDVARDTSQLQFGPGSELWDYWTKGKGLARWAGAEHKWTVLNRLLREAGVPTHEVDGLTTNIIEHVFPGYMKHAHAKKGLSRMSSDEDADRAAQRSEPTPYARSWALDDIQILRTADGYSDGRTVEAYAAVFDTPAEITDQQGHYMEKIARTAFNRTLSHGIERVGVFYNHGLTAHGTPASGPGSVPIGSPVEIRPDGKGLRTVTRLNRSETAEHVLEAIRNGDIKGYSFRGRIYRSSPNRVPRTRSGSLPTVTRTELGLTEYGPTWIPAYPEAGILAVRSQLDQISGQLAELASALPSTPLDPDGEPATPDPGPGAEDPRNSHSARQKMLRLRRQLRERGL